MTTTNNFSVRFRNFFNYPYGGLCSTVWNVTREKAWEEVKSLKANEGNVCEIMVYRGDELVWSWERPRKAG
jgi:hypothetical protein